VADQPKETDPSLSAASDAAPGGTPSVPPPSAELLALVARGGPVRTRHPGRTLAVVALASVLWAAGLLFLGLGVRPDVRALPLVPTVLYAIVCLTGFGAELAFALVPSPSRVLPTAYESARYSLIIVAIAVPLALVFAGAHRSGGGSAASAWHAGLACAGGGLAVAALPVLLGLHALRRVVPGGAWRTSLSLGASAGILAALTLQLHCSTPGLVHVAVAHGAAMVIPAVLLVLLHRH
jgi:hypothetical protein